MFLLHLFGWLKHSDAHFLLHLPYVSPLPGISPLAILLLQFHQKKRLPLPPIPCHPANSQRVCAGPWGMPQLLISLYHLTRRRQGKMRRALPYPETPRRPSIPRLWRGRCSTNRPQAAFPAPSSPRPASISKTPAAARRSAPAARALPACTGSQPPERRPLFTGRQTPGMAAQRAAALPLPFGLFFVLHSEKGKKRQAAPMALPAMFQCIWFIKSVKLSASQ